MNLKNDFLVGERIEMLVQVQNQLEKKENL